MTDDVGNLMLEQFRQMRSEIAALRVEQRETRDRVASMERTLAEVPASIAMLSGRVDHLADRVERVEVRLGLVDV